MYSLKNLPGMFCGAANFKSANINGAYFSDDERAALDQLMRPYMFSGLVKEAAYQEGAPIAILLVKKHSRNGNANLIFCLLKEQSARHPATYYLNFCGGIHHGGTVNFDHVMQHTRLNMDRVYGAPIINHLHIV